MFEKCGRSDGREQGKYHGIAPAVRVAADALMQAGQRGVRYGAPIFQTTRAAEWKGSDKPSFRQM